MVEQRPQPLKHFESVLILRCERKGAGIQIIHRHIEASIDHIFCALFKEFLQLGTHCGRCFRLYFGIYNLLNFSMHIAVQAFFSTTPKQVVPRNPRFAFVYGPREETGGAAPRRVLIVKDIRKTFWMFCIKNRDSVRATNNMPVFFTVPLIQRCDSLYPWPLMVQKHLALKSLLIGIRS